MIRGNLHFGGNRGALAMGGEIAHDALEMVEYRDNPPVHIFGDNEAAIERMREAALAAECRILDVALIGPGIAPPAACAGRAPILIEVEAASDSLLPLLDWVQSEAEAGRRRSLVSGPFILLDLIATRTPHPDVTQLCAPGEGERALEVALTSRRRLERLNDIGRDEGALTLQRLSEDVGRIAEILASLSEDEAASASKTGAGGNARTDEPAADAAFIRSMIRARRLRDQYFRGDLFADPAWDMLLDLMAARLEKNRVAVSSLCIAAAVPATTALRWIKALTDRGLFVRQADPQDGRRVYIELSDETARALAAYLRAVQRISTNAV